MQIYFTQVYIGVGFPFSCDFQRFLSKEVTATALPSTLFIKKYGADFKLVFIIAARTEIQHTEIAGPSIFRKLKRVEYGLRLPYDVVVQGEDAPRVAVRLLIEGVCAVFDKLMIDKLKLIDKLNSLIDHVCTSPEMLEAPSRNPVDNQSQARLAFEAFYNRLP